MFVLCLCMYQADDSKDEKKDENEDSGEEAWIHTTNQIQINSNDFNLIQKKLNSKQFN